MSQLRDFQLPPLQDPTRHASLQKWASNALDTLNGLQNWLAPRLPTDLTNTDVAAVVAIAVPLTGDDDWVADPTRAVANDVMTRLPNPTLEVISCVLSQHVKPLFLKAQHSMVNPISGRRLPRAAGGPSAALDFYDDQEWKTFPGTPNVLIWCIRHLKSEDYEHIWHLVIPPTMTILDDYESYYKLKGVMIVSELIERVPPLSLQRTGIGGLLTSSLRATMVHLHSPLTPEILRRSIPLLLRVIDLTTAADSKDRFDQICAMLGDGIIGGIWLYASTDYETLEASMATLPAVLRELGIGSVRYLKAIISQLVHTLTSLPSQPRCVPMQLKSLEALEAVIEICRPRICNWTGPIVDGLARSWVTIQKAGLTGDEKSKMRQTLRRVSQALSGACPSVVNNEYRRLLECDAAMFRGLIAAEIDHQGS